MNRKSQVEKFEARLGKIKKDEEVIKESEIRNNTPEKRAEKIAKNNGISTEDIFAIITRESINPFVKMWNNSMEDVIRETIRNEIKDLVSETIREELISAYKGFIRGMTNIETIEKAIKEEVKETVHQTFTSNENITSIVEQNVKSDSSQYGELNQYILNFAKEGGNPGNGKAFKSSSSRANGLYQKFIRHNKGIKGAWNEYVDLVLNNNK